MLSFITRHFSDEARFSYEASLQLFEQIEELEVSERFGSSDSKKVLRAFTESLLWHDKMSPAVFDHIMERDVMGTLVRIFANSGLPFTAKLYIIQSVTMLLLNLSRITSIFLVCSNNHLNVMISVDLQDADDELLSSYTSFLKSIAMRLTQDWVQLFLVPGTTYVFPLLEKAVELLAVAADAMVQAAARQIIIVVLQLTDEHAVECTQRLLPEIVQTLLHHVKDRCDGLGKAVLSCRSELLATHAGNQQLRSTHAMSTAMEDVVDDLLFFSDVVRLLPTNSAVMVAYQIVLELVHPMARTLLHHVALRGEPWLVGERRGTPLGSSAQPDGSLFVFGLHPVTLLEVLRRWVGVTTNTEVLMTPLSRSLFALHAGSESVNVLACVLLSSCTQLHPNTVRLWLALDERCSSACSPTESPHSPSAHAQWNSWFDVLLTRLPAMEEADLASADVPVSSPIVFTRRCLEAIAAHNDDAPLPPMEMLAAMLHALFHQLHTPSHENDVCLGHVVEALRKLCHCHPDEWSSMVVELGRIAARLFDPWLQGYRNALDDAAAVSTSAIEDGSLQELVTVLHLVDPFEVVFLRLDHLLQKHSDDVDAGRCVSEDVRALLPAMRAPSGSSRGALPNTHRAASPSSSSHAFNETLEASTYRCWIALREALVPEEAPLRRHMTTELRRNEHNHTSLPVRCEVGLCCEEGDPSSRSATPWHSTQRLVVLMATAILLDRNSTPVFVLRLASLHATVHSVLPCCVVVRYLAPQQRLVIHLKMETNSVAASVAANLCSSAGAARMRGAQLCRELIYP